jgi:xanthine dehydrogenase molybdopterin-binding subunit B
VRVITASDIQGENRFDVECDPTLNLDKIPVLPEKYVEYAGQPIAVVVAGIQQIHQSITPI